MSEDTPGQITITYDSNIRIAGSIGFAVRRLKEVPEWKYEYYLFGSFKGSMELGAQL